MVDVVIPTKNSAKTLRLCVNALRATGAPIDDILVIDGYSTDGTQMMARELGCKVYESHMGVAGARRMGALMACGPRFIMCDSDVEVSPVFWTFLGKRKEPLVKGIYRNMLPRVDAPIAQRDYDWLLRRVGSFDCCIVDRATFLAFTTDWVNMDSGEDTCFYERLERHNVPVYQSSVVVSRHHVGSAMRLVKQMRWYGEGTRGHEEITRFNHLPKQLIALEMLGLIPLGVIESIKYRSWRLVWYEWMKLLYWVYGYLEVKP